MLNSFFCESKLINPKIKNTSTESKIKKKWKDCGNLNLAENWEILDVLVVISNKINHLVCILSQLFRIHWLQIALPDYFKPTEIKSKTKVK